MTDLTTIKDALVRATDETEAAEREYHLYRFGRGELLEAWTDLNVAKSRRKDWQIMGLYDLDALDQAVHEAAQALMPLEAKKRALMQEAQRTRANLKSRVRRLVAKDWTDEEWTFLEESVQRANAVKHGIIQRDEPEPEPEAVSETVSEPALEITSPEQLSQVLQELLENEETRTETVAGLLQRFPEDDILRLACMYLTNQDGFAEWLNKYVWERRQYEDSRAVIADARHGDWIEISAERLQEARRDHAAGTGMVTPALRLVKRSGAGEWRSSVPLFGTRWTLVQDHDAPCSGAVVYLKTD